MKIQSMLAASFVLAVPALLAQQADTPPNPSGPMAQHQWQGHESMPMHKPGEGGPQMHGMPMGHGEMEHHHEMDHHHGMGHEEFWKNPAFAARVGLTPDQVKKLDSISLAGQIQIIHLHAALEEQELMMHSSMEGADFDEKKADMEIDKLADAHAALEKAEAKLHVSERAVLTPDQWTKMHTPMEHGPMGHGSTGHGPMGHGGAQPQGAPGAGAE